MCFPGAHVWDRIHAEIRVGGRLTIISSNRLTFVNLLRAYVKCFMLHYRYARAIGR